MPEPSTIQYLPFTFILLKPSINTITYYQRQRYRNTYTNCDESSDPERTEITTTRQNSGQQ